MYRYIRFKANDESFYDAETDKLIGTGYIKLDQSWILSSQVHNYAKFVISTSLSNANKAKTPSEIHGPLEGYGDIVFILKNTTNDWGITMLQYDDWKKLHDIGISDVYYYGRLDLVTIPIQIIDGVEVNPIISMRNYELADHTEEENGFNEHYLVVDKYRRIAAKPSEAFNDLAPVNHYRAYIIQALQDGTKVMYCEKTPGHWDF